MWREYYAYSFENTSLTGGTGTAFVPTIIRLDPDADFEIWSRSHVATDDRIYVRMSDDSYGRYQQNIASSQATSVGLDLRSISGKASSVTGLIHPNSFLPCWLPFPYLLAGGTTATCEFADFANGGTNSIRMTWHGCKLRQDRAPWARQWKQEVPFNYTTGLVSLSANGTQTLTLSVGTDAHFRIDQLMAVRTGAALVTVKDGASDRQWMDKPVHIDNLFGNSQFPHRLPAPRMVYRGSVISITIQDLSGSTNSIQLQFVGTKLVGQIPGVDVEPVAQTA